MKYCKKHRDVKVVMVKLHGCTVHSFCPACVKEKNGKKNGKN